jgi:hypothetical protein
MLWSQFSATYVAFTPQKRTYGMYKSPELWGQAFHRFCWLVGKLSSLSFHSRGPNEAFALNSALFRCHRDRNWATLGDVGRRWATLGDVGRRWATLGDVGRRWATLGNFSPLGRFFDLRKTKVAECFCFYSDWKRFVVNLPKICIGRFFNLQLVATWQGARLGKFSSTYVLGDC